MFRQTNNQFVVVLGNTVYRDTDNTLPRYIAKKSIAILLSMWHMWWNFLVGYAIFVISLHSNRHVNYVAAVVTVFLPRKVRSCDHMSSIVRPSVRPSVTLVICIRCQLIPLPVREKNRLLKINLDWRHCSTASRKCGSASTGMTTKLLQDNIDSNVVCM